MIRLTAYKNGTAYDLDVYGDETIPLTLNVEDIRDIGSKKGSYTKDFDLPATQTNNQFFGHINDIQNFSSTNPFIGYRAELYVDSNLVFSGFLYLVEYLDKTGENHYKVTIYSEMVELMASLGEATLSDLTYTDLAHTFTKQNVIDSWGTTGVSLTGGGNTTDVFYPLTQTKGVVAYPIMMYIMSARNLTPWVRLKYFVDKIFAYAGFVYDSTFLNSATFTDIFMDTGLADFTSNADISHALVYTGVPYDDVNWQVNVDDFDIQVTSGDTDAYQDPELAASPNSTYQSNTGGAPLFDQYQSGNGLHVPYIKIIGTSPVSSLGVDQEFGYTGLQDPNNIYNNGTITAPTDNFEFEFYGDYFVYGPIGTQVTLKAQITSGGSTNTITLAQTTISNPTAFYGLTNGRAQLNAYGIYTIPSQNGSFAITLEASATCYLMPYNFGYDMSAYQSGGCGSVTNGVPDICGVKFYDGIDHYMMPTGVYINPMNSGSIGAKIRNNHGDVKLKDILADVIKMFNLHTETVSERRLLLEPYNEYMAQGTTHDWTEKHDSSEMVNLFEELPSKITYKYNNDEDDYALNNYKKGTGSEYGSMVVGFNTDTTNEQEVALEVFSATAVQDLSTAPPYSSVVQKDEAGVWSRLKNKPRLVYKNYTTITYTVEDRAGIFDHTGYQMASHFNATPANINSTTLNLNFGLISPYYIANSLSTFKTLYFDYYFTYVQERYTEDRVFVKTRVKLTPQDISSFSFRDKVRINNQLYIVNKIEYNAGETGLSKVELLRV